MTKASELVTYIVDGLDNGTLPTGEGTNTVGLLMTKPEIKDDLRKALTLALEPLLSGEPTP